MSVKGNLTIQEEILNSSRFSPLGNGTKCSCSQNQPTSQQKWWASILFGFLFAIISSPVAYFCTDKIAEAIDTSRTIQGKGASIFGLLLHTIIFILIVRIILW